MQLDSFLCWYLYVYNFEADHLGSLEEQKMCSEERYFSHFDSSLVSHGTLSRGGTFQYYFFFCFNIFIGVILVQVIFNTAMLLRHNMQFPFHFQQIALHKMQCYRRGPGLQAYSLFTPSSLVFLQLNGQELNCTFYTRVCMPHSVSLPFDLWQYSLAICIYFKTIFLQDKSMLHLSLGIKIKTQVSIRDMVL